MTNYDLLIIGAGTAGMAAAKKAAEYGAKVGIVEKEKVGGTCVNRGCTPKKLMVYAADFALQESLAASYGWQECARKIDWSLLMQKIHQHLDKISSSFIETFTEKGIDLLYGEAEFTGERTIKINNQEISADKILITVGGHPLKPDIPGKELAITSREMFQLPEIPQKLAIVGGGYIGVEFASMMHAFGSEVILMDTDELILSGFDRDLRKTVQQGLIDRGIEFMGETTAEKIERAEDKLQLYLSNGKNIIADKVLLATGRAPNTKSLNLDKASVEVGDKGEIKVDKYCRTQNRDIYAVGDCIDRIALTPVAKAEALAVVETLYGKKTQCIDYTYVTSAVFARPEAATVGMTETEARDKYGDEVNCYCDRKRVEALLKRQLKAIEASLDGIAILHDNKFIYLNQSYLYLFGYSHPEELLGQSWNILYDREQIDFLETEAFPLLQEYGYWRGEIKAKHRDGNTFDEELSLTLSEQGDLICIGRDISERKQAELALRESEQRYRYIYDNTPVMLHSIDETGKLISVSNYWLERLGYEREEVIGRKSTEFLTEESRHYAQNAILTEFFQTGICTDIPYQIICKNGEIKDVLLSAIAERNTSGEIIRSLAVMVDVTELKQTEAALRESEARFRIMADSVPIMIWMSGVDGLINYLNPCWLDFTGRSLEQDLGNGWTEIIHPQDRQDAFQTYMSAFDARQSFQMQYRLRRADGEYRWLLSTGIPRFNPDGNFAGYIGSCTDITEIKQAKEQLSQANLELEQRVDERTAALIIAKEVAETANRAKDNFIAHMNHELRTPLNGILGFTQILQKDPHLTNQQSQNLNLIQQSGRHLLDLINDILNFSKIEADKIELEERDFNLSDFLDNLVYLSHLRAEQKNIDFHYLFSSSLPQVVKADETRLRQVLLNLLSNAIKFTERGEVTFQVGYLEDFELEANRDRGDGEDRGDGGAMSQSLIPSPQSTVPKIRFQIKDKGIGIPENKLADIFLPFEQVHEAQSDREGTGLGLTISQKLIQLMGSQIQVSSTVGKGSIFWFDLDLLEGDPANVSTSNLQSEIHPMGFSGRPRKVLIVDDISDNRQLLIQYLQPLGFELAEAENGRQGLTVAETFKPDLILLDALMPEMNGLEMLQQLKQHPQLQETKVIFVSANSQFREQLQTSQLQFEDFLSKPVDLNQLLQSLQTHLQLQWLFSESAEEVESDSLVAPPQEQLLQLWELAEMGDMAEIESQINSLEQLDSQYLPFVNKVRKSVESFNQNQLIKFLEYVRESP